MKKNLMSNVLLVCIIVMSSLTGCKKDSAVTGVGSNQSSQLTFTIDGDGHSNEKITINGVSSVLENGGEYFSKHGFSSFRVGDSPAEGAVNKNYLFCAFDGQKEGTQTFGTAFADTGGTQVDVNIILTITSAAGVKKIYDSNTTVFGYKPKGSVTITHYNAVNQTIEGTFTGKLANGVTGEFITISNGTFIVPRHKDIPL